MGREFPKLVTLVNLLGDNFVYLSGVYKCIIDTFLPSEKFYMNTLEEEEPRQGVYAGPEADTQVDGGAVLEDILQDQFKVLKIIFPDDSPPLQPQLSSFSLI